MYTMSNEYDKILRDNFKELKTNLLRQLVTAKIVIARSLVPKMQQTVIERETDTVAEIETVEGKRFIVHIEWQSSNDPRMASRMAMYDLMLNQTYGMEVMGAVLYLGNDPLRMNREHSFFDFRYQCKMIDVRQLDPEIFLASDNAGEIIFAILTGEGGLEQKEVTIRKIFAKLQLLYADDRAMLLVKIKQLEMLSLLRGKFIQQKILEEERNMAVTIDIREDLRYQQGLGEGIEKGIKKSKC